MSSSNCDPLVPIELLALTERFIAKHPECFWFRHPEARIRALDDVRLVIEHLRTHGGRLAWYEAQELQRCLSRLSNETS